MKSIAVLALLYTASAVQVYFDPPLTDETTVATHLDKSEEDAVATKMVEGDDTLVAADEDPTLDIGKGIELESD